MGAKLTIAVDVSLQFEENSKIDNVIDIVMRSAQITTKKLNEHLKSQADFILLPAIGDIHWSEFYRIDEIIEKGRLAAKEKIPDIKRHISKKLKFLHKWFN